MFCSQLQSFFSFSIFLLKFDLNDIWVTEQNNEEQEWKINEKFIHEKVKWQFYAQDLLFVCVAHHVRNMLQTYFVDNNFNATPYVFYIPCTLYHQNILFPFTKIDKKRCWKHLCDIMVRDEKILNSKTKNHRRLVLMSSVATAKWNWMG